MTEAGCKTDIVIERYGLTAPDPRYDSLDDYLVARWTGADDQEAQGYEQLTEWFNKRLLKQVYERHGRETLGARLDSEYAALTGDDDLLRQEVVDDLVSGGIDATTVVEDMVSWSTLRRHLKECLGAEKDTATVAGDSNWELKSVDIARNQIEGKADDALRSLATKEKLPGADQADVEVQIKLSCPECPTRVPLEDAVERGYVCRDHLASEEDRSGDSESPSSVVRSLLATGGLPALAYAALGAARSGDVVEAAAALPITDLAMLV